MPADRGEREGQKAQAAATRAPPRRRGERVGAVILDDLLVPLNTGRGVRVVAVGVTGSGKSYALRRIVELARDRVDVVYAIDDSDDIDKWRGQRRLDLTDCAQKPLVARANG